MADDSIRNRSINLLCKSLKAPNSGTERSLDQLSELSAQIENYLHELHPDAPGYKESIRSHAQNLKNPSTHLRELLVSGDLSPERFAEMGTEEMASPERREEKEKLRRDSLVGSIGPGVVGLEELVRGESETVGLGEFRKKDDEFESERD